MDQIGSDPAFFTGQPANLSQQFTDTGLTGYSAAVVDDFTISGRATLTNVSAAVDGYSLFKSFSGVSGWEVAIYSSVAAASSSLTGNVYDRTFAPAAVTVTSPFGGDINSGLVSIPTNILLPTAGTYYLAVLAQNSFSSNGEIAVYDANGPTGAAPGGLNAYQTSPSDVYAFTEQALNENAAYSVSAVVVPEPAALSMLGVVGAVATRRRRHGGGNSTSASTGR